MRRITPPQSLPPALSRTRLGFLAVWRDLRSRPVRLGSMPSARSCPRANARQADTASVKDKRCVRKLVRACKYEPSVTLCDRQTQLQAICSHMTSRLIGIKQGCLCSAIWPWHSSSSKDAQRQTETSGASTGEQPSGLHAESKPWICPESAPESQRDESTSAAALQQCFIHAARDVSPSSAAAVLQA